MEKEYLRKFIINIIINIKLHSSKILHTWEFYLKGKYNKIEFWDSRLSGKKKIAVNCNVIVENNKSVAIFNYSFRIDDYFFNLIQLTDNDYELRINNNLFQDIIKYQQSKNTQRNEIEEDDKNNENADNVFNNDSENKNFTCENNGKILNQIDFFSKDNINNNNNYKDPNNFSFKNSHGIDINNSNNNNINDFQTTGNFFHNNNCISNEDNNNNMIDDNNDINNFDNNNNNVYNEYPSMSEL